jgi:hypothetical protein
LALCCFVEGLQTGFIKGLLLPHSEARVLDVDSFPVDFHLLEKGTKLP